MTNIMKRNNNGNAGVSKTGSMTPFGGWVDGVLQNTLHRFFEDDLQGFDGLSINRQVPVNIRETQTSFELEVVAPGLNKEDFKVDISKDLLTVAFEHKEENQEDNKQQGYLRKEYRMQSFSRSFTLGDTVNAEAISAEYRNGVLHIHLPKNEKAQKLSRNIQVQ
jgi:HSP20 family protein